MRDGESDKKIRRESDREIGGEGERGEKRGNYLTDLVFH